MALAFHYCGDADMLRIARTSVELMLRVLQSLFDVEMDKIDFTVAEIEAHADKIFDIPPMPEDFRLGLYLAPEFGALAGWTGKSDQVGFSSVRIAESIVEISDPTKTWDECIARSIAYAEATENGKEEHAMGLGTVAFMPSAMPSVADFGWSIIHDDIAKVAKGRFDSGHFADAAEAAFKLINERLKKIVRERLSKEYDGVSLMQKVFSTDKPVLVLDDLSTMIGQDIQLGYQQIFSGAMRGIRNPKAHSNVQIDAERSMHLIFLASLLMSKVDEALARETLMGTVPGAQNSEGLETAVKDKKAGP